MQPEKRRDGLRTLYNVSRTLCRVVTLFAPGLRLKYRDNESVLNAIALAESVCSILPALEDAFVFTGVNEDIPDNPSQIGGVTPNAPLPPEPSP